MRIPCIPRALAFKANKLRRKSELIYFSLFQFTKNVCSQLFQVMLRNLHAIISNFIQDSKDM